MDSHLGHYNWWCDENSWNDEISCNDQSIMINNSNINNNHTKVPKIYLNETITRESQNNTKYYELINNIILKFKK